MTADPPHDEKTIRNLRAGMRMKNRARRELLRESLRHCREQRTQDARNHVSGSEHESLNDEQSFKVAAYCLKGLHAPSSQEKRAIRALLTSGA
ncbi:hypothetical protein NDU88_010914 [Pleurodeles waltl]|uniref:Uncharacterized protein n=1 Tax=Pleurodeles waltl TaxID=8319 RepID=A0AAV7S204_PLEWA|nr:hypothetical protein NDU88_010914 [Pleurodeles waltl]